MKIRLSKKAQVYGLSSFIYALAIALILLVGLIGMSKEFETKSHSADYEAQTLIISRTAENVKKLLSEERSYVLDKSLYLTGAYGGSQSFRDLQNWGTGCGNKDNTMFSYLPEKQVPLWYSLGKSCIPTDSEVVDAMRAWTEGPFSRPDAVITDVLKELSGGRIFSYVYIPKILSYTSSSFEVSWFPNGTVTEYWADANSKTGVKAVSTKLTDVTLIYPPRNPVIEYSFEPFVHSESNTPFFQIKHEAENFVRNNELRGILNDSNNDTFPIPYFLDEAFISAKRDTSYASEKNCATDTYPSSNCTKPQTYKRPFTALVINAYSNYPTVYLDDWNKYLCPSVDITKVSASYSSSCKIFTKYNLGKKILEVDSSRGVNGFEGLCNATADTNDKKAMRCVLISEINQVNMQLPAIMPESGFNWKIAFNTFNLTYNGASSTEFEFNTTGH